MDDDAPLLSGAGNGARSDSGSADLAHTIDFDDFAQSKLDADPAEQKRADPAASVSNREEAPARVLGEAVPPADAARFINIPELPSASAEWASDEVAVTFKQLLTLSVVQLIWSIPLLLLVMGILSLLGAIFGLCVACLYLCECCQSVMLEANVKLVKVFATVAIVLDSIFLLFWTSIVVSDIGFEITDHTAIAFILFVTITSAGSVYMCYKVAVAAQKIVGLMHPVQAGTVIVV